jgi:transketolase
MNQLSRRRGVESDMRQVFCQSLVAEAARPDFVFLTGDLGFMALEPLRDVMGDRFINCGVAEQNLVTVAAALARAGMRPWLYSIAPFLYARPFEQVRNDVCLHDLPVVLVGNGGGYGYGVMGATHHALEDYGVLLSLPNLRAYVPAFDGDLRAQVRALFDVRSPAYLRLGLSEEPAGAALPSYAAWRKLLAGGAATVVVVGPLVGGLLAAAGALPHARRPNLWLLCELPVARLPQEFLADVRRSDFLVVIEEHVAQGGAGRMLAHVLLEAGAAPRRFACRAAQGYVSGLYGSQKFHRAESGLDPESLLEFISGADPV